MNENENSDWLCSDSEEVIDCFSDYGECEDSDYSQPDLRQLKIINDNTIVEELGYV